MTRVTDRRDRNRDVDGEVNVVERVSTKVTGGLGAAAVCAAVVASAACGVVEAQGRSARVKEFVPGAAPQVRDGAVHYSLDILLDARPGIFWCYYDRHKRALVVELLDTRLESGDFSIPPKLPFGKPIVARLSSKKSITRDVSTIVIPLEEGWHHECSSKEDCVMRIEVWKPLQHRAARHRRSIGIIPYILLGALAAGATFGLVTAIAVKNQD